MSDTPTPAPEQATLANWRTAPFSRWAFHHVDQIIPCAGIAAASDQPFALPSDRRPLEDFKLLSGDGSALTLADFLHATATDALVVLLGGRLVYEFYDHGNAAHTPHILMSATKSVIGLLAGILRRRGALDTDTPVSDLVPEIAGTAYQGATIRQLLDMRTGIELDAPALRAYAAATGWEPATPGDAETGLHAFFASLGVPYRDHGGPFRYVSANTDLLGWAIERATGHRVASLLSGLLWQPLGAEDGAYITLDPQGAPRCTGGLCATARDFARIGQLLVQDGRRGDLDIVPKDWLDDIADHGDLDAWRRGEFAAGFAGMTMRYRSGWYVVDDAPKTLFAMGIHGQNLFVDRSNRLVIAKLSSQANPIDYQAVSLTHRAVAEVRRCLIG